MNSIPNIAEGALRAFAQPLEHLNAELRRFDILLHREILRLRANYQLSLDEFRGLYISDEQVDRLVARTVGASDDEDAIARMTDEAEALCLENERRAGPELPWRRLAESFRLTREERDLLLVALAPDLDLKYETLYAYLNNDVTRKWPTCELALRVLSPASAAKPVYRQLLMPQAPLFEHGILRWTPPTGDRPRWLAGAISVAPAVVQFLLGQPALEHELAFASRLYVAEQSWDDIALHPSIMDELQGFVRHAGRHQAESLSPVLVLSGRSGSGRTKTAEAFAGSMGVPLLTFDLQAARVSELLVMKSLPSLLLHQRLHDAVLLVTHGELLLEKEGHVTETQAMMEILARATRPVVVSALPGGRWRELVTRQRVHTIEFADLSSADRAALWLDAAARSGLQMDHEAVEAVADRFILTPGQIENAVALVAQRKLPDTTEMNFGEEVWLEAARGQSDHSLAQLAVKVRLAHTWRDVVLPPVTLSHLKQITEAIRHRRRVYEDWGFERRISTGKGLKLLFSGPSGTGKTMTAGVIARELGLDLYKIDLSCVVSKYIGETEKNLDRIFRAAHCSNSILFFDEADALFGKRTEVKDAHDRYANVEVAYLLQKLEEHDGAVILATNLNKNIDEAFSRRMHYAVRFPLPDAADRERLWRGMFPPQTPMAEDIDFEFVSSHFSFTGGDIKNIALDAAFRAAADGGVLTMRHLVRAIAQQVIKDGRNPTVADFRHYRSMLPAES